MHRNLPEKLRDDIIGEATIAILKESGQISFESLLNKLKVMLHSEYDNEKQEAIKTAVDFIADKLIQSIGKSHAIYDSYMTKFYISNSRFKKH